MMSVIAHVPSITSVGRFPPAVGFGSYVRDWLSSTIMKLSQPNNKYRLIPFQWIS